MPNPQRSRAVLAAIALVLAVTAESTVNQALAQGRRPHHVGRHHHHQRPPAAQPKPQPKPQQKPQPQPEAPGPVFASVPDRSVALGLPAALDQDGATVDVGYPDAPVRMTLFEDYRCSETARFEGLQGPTLRDLIARHRLLVHYVVESSLDERLPGPGAVTAADAARAALERGRFALFHALLLANQGPEEVDGFTPDRVLALAAQVPGLRSADFDARVRTLYWKPWVDAAQHLYDTAGVHHGTPSMLLNGSEVDLWARPELLSDPAALRSFVENAANRGE